MSKETGKKRRTTPKTSPLTLTRITNGPKNRNKGKHVEAIREEEEPIEIQQPQPENEAPELPQGQRSVSLILTFSPEVRQVQPKQGESSEPLSSSSAMLTLLQTMRQEMEERDKQLKLQLQLRDEYMEVELKRRHQNLEEALK